MHEIKVKGINKKIHYTIYHIISKLFNSINFSDIKGQLSLPFISYIKKYILKIETLTFYCFHFV